MLDTSDSVVEFDLEKLKDTAHDFVDCEFASAVLSVFNGVFRTLFNVGFFGFTANIREFNSFSPK